MYSDIDEKFQGKRLEISEKSVSWEFNLCPEALRVVLITWLNFLFLNNKMFKHRADFQSHLYQSWKFWLWLLWSLVQKASLFCCRFDLINCSPIFEEFHYKFYLFQCVVIFKLFCTDTKIKTKTIFWPFAAHGLHMEYGILYRNKNYGSKSGLGTGVILTFWKIIHTQRLPVPKTIISVKNSSNWCNTQIKN